MASHSTSGGCQCGAVRYLLLHGPHSVYACHCLKCQRQAASAFAMSVPIATGNLVIKGDLAAYERLAESGAATRCWFCRSCGTRLYHQSSRSPS